MKRKILAFVHINKAAGTTLTHVLRLNFFMTHVDVKAISKSSHGVFQSADMKKIMIINPFVRSIAGHDVKPFSDLSDTFPGIRYITLLRDPIQRTISHYQYSIEKHGSNLSFNEYLRTKASYNRQTRAIAGSGDISLAKNTISKCLFLVGIVEEFDEFLFLLKKKLEPFKFRPGYMIQNAARRDSSVRTEIKRKFANYHQKIVERNFLDIELYNYVKNEVLPSEKKVYGPTFEYDVRQFKNTKKCYERNLLRYIDYIIREAYYNQIFKLVIRTNKLK